MITRHICLGILWLFLFSPFAAVAEGGKPQVLVVYWSSEDCTWCRYWEGMSGMERRFKEWAGFKNITFRTVKNRRLADPYNMEHFSPDIQWIYERLQSGEEKRPGRPGWAVYVDRKRVATFQGTKGWDEKHFPAIQRILAENTREPGK